MFSTVYCFFISPSDYRSCQWNIIRSLTFSKGWRNVHAIVSSRQSLSAKNCRFGPQQQVHKNIPQQCHYSAVIMSAVAPQITGVSITNATVCSGADQRKIQSCASLACVGNSPVNPQQRAGKAENASIWWRQHDILNVHNSLWDGIMWHRSKYKYDNGLQLLYRISATIGCRKIQPIFAWRFRFSGVNSRNCQSVAFLSHEVRGKTYIWCIH